MSARSRVNRRSMPARSTFTATARTPSPVFTSARWTWAIDAAAIGSPKFSNERIDLPAERGLDNADRGLAAHRSDAVLQALEIERDLRSDDIGTSRQELPELDVGRSQPVDRPGEAGQPVDVALGDEVCEAQRQARDGRQKRRIDADERPFAREHIACAHEPQAVAERRHDRHNQSFQPEWIATIPPLRRVKSTRAKPACPIMSANCSGDGNLRINSTR